MPGITWYNKPHNIGALLEECKIFGAISGEANMSLIEDYKKFRDALGKPIAQDPSKEQGPMNCTIASNKLAVKAIAEEYRMQRWKEQHMPKSVRYTYYWGWWSN